MNRGKQGESSAQNPAIQVVGFRVEGGAVSPSPSPALKSVLSDSAEKDHSSVTPVIIPPAFHLREESEELSRSISDPLIDKTPVQRTLTAPAGTYAQHVKGDPHLEALVEGKREGFTEEEASTIMINGNQSNNRPNESNSSNPLQKETINNISPIQFQPQDDNLKQLPNLQKQTSLKKPSQSENRGQEIQKSSVNIGGVEAGGGGGEAKGGGGGEKAVEVKGGGAPLETPPAKKVTTRAERRALQEKQKAEKAARREAEGKGPSQKQSQKNQEIQKQQYQQEQSIVGDNISKKIKSEAQATSSGFPTRVTEWFAHLPQFNKLNFEEILECKEAQHAHPLIIQLGKKFVDGAIKGGSERCVVMLETLIKVIQDYQTPIGKELPRDVSSHVNAQIAFLVRCKPLSAVMGNAIRSLKHTIIQIDPNQDENTAKKHIIEQINNYIQEKITFAGKQLCQYAVSKIQDGDVIMVYSYSTVVLSALLLGQKQGKRFQVIVVDSRPNLEGRKLLKQLIKFGIRCQYTHLNAIFYCMKEVSKVFLGASAVCSNGTIINSVGTAAVAACANYLSKPVLVLCETCKFTERVQLDSFTNNEMGDPNELLKLGVQNSFEQSADLLNWQKEKNLGLVNQKSDLTKAEHVTLIVTELGMLPPTSVPAVIREYRSDQQGIVWG
eukprot:TRINITY_DN24571_c0_g2_i1.p1 TRINITY_DN24571_c0_g2~~TRINITY_DN24571_c0_g2_i1.p1  ORF type:complete len:692 (+),score=129.40 TRINITY_DN24571_c0_g2_i1:76-2076(+)